MKPVIGILSNVSMSELEDCSSLEKTFVNSSYVTAVIKSGGIPLVIPVNTDEDIVKYQIKLCQGIIISGGIDINPILYNEEPVNGMGSFNPDLDTFDILSIKEAINRDIPILGICRGIQILNVALGGTLYQDIGLCEGNFIKHMQQTKKHVPTHSIKIVKDSLLSSILGEETYVNSYHHQCIKDLAEGFKVVAYSKDGIIEAIEMKNTEFVLGVEWHPELMIENDEKMMNLFYKFIQVCSK